MLRRFLFGGVLACLALARTVPAQLAYDATTFIHGLSDTGGRWLSASNPTGVSPVSSYDSRINLKAPFAPSFSSTASIQQQSNELLNFLATNLSGFSNKVLVGHSMGGLVARRAYLNASSGITGIITIGTAHSGTFAANNGQQFPLYLDHLILRTQQSATAATAGLLGPIAALIVNNFASNKLAPYKTQLTQQFPNPASAAVLDLRTGSSAVAALQADQRDAAIQRANVFGVLPAVRNFPIRMMASKSGDNFNSLVTDRNRLKTFFRTCKHVMYATIVSYGSGRVCSKADRVLGRLDERFLGWTNGFQPNGKPRNVPFDGLVPVERTGYPGLTDPQRNIQALNVDHFSILFDLGSGVPSVATAMTRIGMESR